MTSSNIGDKMRIFESYKGKPLEVGDLVEKNRFAFFPTTMTNGDVVLWETYRAFYKRKRSYPHGENYFLIFRDYWDCYKKERIDTK